MYKAGAAVSAPRVRACHSSSATSHTPGPTAVNDTNHKHMPKQTVRTQRPTTTHTHEAMSDPQAFFCAGAILFAV